MKRLVSVVMLATAAGSVFADSGLKPGLWEMRISKNIVDGRDMSAQMAGMSAQLNEAMAGMSPEQRAQMSAMMKQGGMGMPAGAGGGAIKMCVTPEMAKRDAPPVGKDGACQPTNVQRTGNHMSYEFSCVTNGTKTSGKGESTLNGDSVTTKSDTTTVEHGGTHHMQTESVMRFVKSDCGDVKPKDDTKRHGLQR